MRWRAPCRRGDRGGQGARPRPRAGGRRGSLRGRGPGGRRHPSAGRIVFMEGSAPGRSPRDDDPPSRSAPPPSRVPRILRERRRPLVPWRRSLPLGSFRRSRAPAPRRFLQSRGERGLAPPSCKCRQNPAGIFGFRGTLGMFPILRPRGGPRENSESLNGRQTGHAAASSSNSLFYLRSAFVVIMARRDDPLARGSGPGEEGPPLWRRGGEDRMDDANFG